jgi:hypothetical protein
MRSVASTFALLALSTAVVAVAGCSSDDQSDRGGDYGYPQDDKCNAATSCGECTPILGCGWCSYPDGTGACASSAARCTGDTFRWNWEPTGCPSDVIDSGTATDAPADSSPKSDVASDAPSDAPVNDAPSESASEGEGGGDGGGSDSAPDVSPPACTLPTSGLNGCVPTTGGTLCGASQFTLACHASGGATPSPDASLKCAVEISDATGSYYCCPCAGG